MEIILASLNTIATGLALLFIVISFFLNRNGIKKQLRDIRKNVWMMLVLIFALSLVLNFFVSPRVHIDVGNGVDYLEMGENILHSGRGVVAATGGETFTHQPLGWPFALAIVFMFTGVHAGSAFLTSTLLASIAVIAIFLAAYMMFRKETLALISSFIFSITPGIILLSGTTQPNASSLLFVSLTIFSFYFFIREKTVKSQFMLVSSLALLIHYRHEFALFLPILACMIFIYRKDVPFRIEIKQILLLILLFLLILPQCFSMAVNSDLVTGTGEELIVSNMKNVMFPFYLNQAAHPVFLTLLMLVGVICTFSQKKHDKRPVYFMIIYLASFTVFFLLPIMLLRILLPLYIPISILAAKGIYDLSRMAGAYRGYAVIVISALLMLNSALFFPVQGRSNSIMIDFSETFEMNSLQTRMEIELSDNNPIPRECIVLAGKPEVFGFLPGTKTDYLTLNALEDEEHECIFALKDWCYYTSDSACGDTTEEIDYILENYETEPFLTFESENLEYVFYKIKTKN